MKEKGRKAAKAEHKLIRRRKKTERKAKMDK
jgi:hypothetical protein